MQLGDLLFVNERRGGLAFAEHVSRVLQKLSLPRADHVWVHTLLLGKFRKRLLFTARFERDTRFELRQMVLSFLHFGSSLSSGDSP